MPNRSTKPYDVIADRIIAALDSGVIPWRKPWTLPAGMRPQNSAGRPYSGVNALILGLMPYEDPRWVTYRKAGELGGHVRKGEKSTPIVFLGQHQRDVEGDDGFTIETKTYRVLRYYSVFNAEQCDDLDLPVIQAPTLFDPIESAESIVANMPDAPAIAHDGDDRAYYVARRDTVHLPRREAFADGADYYSTVFHELGHSTGHKSRLNREGIEAVAPFGSPVYSREELVAEFAAAFVSHEAGITSSLENSAAYVQGWAKAIRKDRRLVVQAASQGQKAADCILGRSPA